VDPIPPPPFLKTRSGPASARSGRKKREGSGEAGLRHHDASALRWPASPEVSVPALCFAGTKDDVVPVSDVERWVRQTPTARLVLLEDGHELVASIGRICDEARAFLATLGLP